MGAGERRHADGRAHVVTEDQKRPTHRKGSTVQCHAIHDGAHGVFPNAEVHEASGAIVGVEQSVTVDAHPGVAGQVGPATDDGRNGIDDGIEAVIGCHTGGHLGTDVPRGQRLFPPGQRRAIKAGLQGGVVPGPGGPAIIPLTSGLLATTPQRRHVVGHVIGNPEVGISRYPHDLLGDGDLIGIKRRPMGGRGVGELWRGTADMAAQDDQGGTGGLGHAPAHCSFQGVNVVCDLSDVLDVPSVGSESGCGIIGDREFGHSVDGDVIVVVNHHQMTELLMPGEAGGLVAEAFHEITVAGDDEGVVIEQFRTETGPQ